MYSPVHCTTVVVFSPVWRYTLKGFTSHKSIEKGYCKKTNARNAAFAGFVLLRVSLLFFGREGVFKPSPTPFVLHAGIKWSRRISLYNIRGETFRQKRRPTSAELDWERSRFRTARPMTGNERALASLRPAPGRVVRYSHGSFLRKLFNFPGINLTFPDFENGFLGFLAIPGKVACLTYLSGQEFASAVTSFATFMFSFEHEHVQL
ncbi:hypothetical protein V1264_004531 [Littorina saxatilis]|uniref:Uncharacterized protein n=1 Tax=Littorina saxatilis TaxID=31220 RepID=A0AAN9G6R0_9CAEN